MTVQVFLTEMTVCKTCSQGTELHGLPGSAGSGQEGQCGWDSSQAWKASGGCNEWSCGRIVQQSETGMTANIHSHVEFWLNKQCSFEPFMCLGCTVLIHFSHTWGRTAQGGSLQDLGMVHKSFAALCKERPASSLSQP